MVVGRPRARTETDWGLYLDESGRFDCSDEAVCIAEVMLQEAPAREADEILGASTDASTRSRGTRRTRPTCGSPRGASVRGRSPRRPRAAHPAARTIEQAAALCAHSADAHALAPMFAALGGRPRYDSLASASTWLRRHHPAAERAVRRTKRTSTTRDAAEAIAAPATLVEGLDREQTTRWGMEMFGRVAEAAIERTPMASREARRLAWRQVEELYFDDVTVDDVVARNEAIGPDVPREELKRAANRAMKQHPRFREAMLATASELAGGGVISAEERSLVERMILELKRR